MESFKLDLNIPAKVRQISSSILAEGKRVPSLTNSIVRSIELVLARQGSAGASLGTFKDVQKQLGLGRPACHEVIGILLARGLVRVKNGRSGGLFVVSPALDEAVGPILMYLAVNGAMAECISEFRLIVWRMVVETMFRRPDYSLFWLENAGEMGFAVNLAAALDNRVIEVAARLSELLVRVCGGKPAPAHDGELAESIAARDPARVLRRIEEIAAQTNVAAFDLGSAVERGLVWRGRKSAMLLATRIGHDVAINKAAFESERETAERLNCDSSVVRQARRILQDFGVVSFRQGKKGDLGPKPAGSAGVIRLLAPHFASSSMHENSEVAEYMANEAAMLAVRRIQADSSLASKIFVSVRSDVAFKDLIDSENLMLEISGNPLLGIFVRSLALAACSSHWLGKPPDMLEANRSIFHSFESGDELSTRHLMQAKAKTLKWSIQASARDGTPNI